MSQIRIFALRLMRCGGNRPLDTGDSLSGVVLPQLILEFLPPLEDNSQDYLVEVERMP